MKLYSPSPPSDLGLCDVVVKKEIIQPDMSSAERSYQVQLAEATHWFWANHGSWLACVPDEQQRAIVTRFAALLQHLRGVVLESQAAGASMSILNWLLRRKS